MSGTEDDIKDGQPGAEPQKEQTGAANEDIQNLKKEIAELRKEAAKYRTSAKSVTSEKQTVEEQLKALQEQFEQTKRENLTVKHQALLDKAGCIKSDLVVSAIPDTCEDVQAWIDDYKKENPILFKKETTNHGGGYKPSSSNNSSPAEMMNSFIRQAAGR